MFFGRIVTVRGFLAFSNLTRKTAFMSLAEVEKGWERSVMAANRSSARRISISLYFPPQLRWTSLNLTPFDVLAVHGIGAVADQRLEGEFFTVREIGGRTKEMEAESLPIQHPLALGFGVDTDLIQGCIIDQNIVSLGTIVDAGRLAILDGALPFHRHAVAHQNPQPAIVWKDELPSPRLCLLN